MSEQLPGDVSEMNRKLFEMYSTAFDDDVWSQLSKEQNLQGPLLIHVPLAYHEADVKLMIVGQQTNGWGHPEDGIEALLYQYRCFEMGRERMQSPFWQAAYNVYNFLNPNGPMRGFLWSNLIKVDVNGHRPCPELEELICSTGLLQHELSITQPDVVLFFTGPQYDERLRATFPGVVCKRVNDFVNRLGHDALPGKAFRSYHPRFLSGCKNWHVIDELKKLSRGEDSVGAFRGEKGDQKMLTEVGVLTKTVERFINLSLEGKLPVSFVIPLHGVPSPSSLGSMATLEEILPEELVGKDHNRIRSLLVGCLESGLLYGSHNEKTAQLPGSGQETVIIIRAVTLMGYKLVLRSQIALTY